VWDQKTESLIETSLQHLQSLHSSVISGFQDADIENLKSAKSAWDGQDQDDLQTLQTLKSQSLQAETGVNKGFADNADNADIVSNADENFDEPPEFIEI